MVESNSNKVVKELLALIVIFIFTIIISIVVKSYVEQNRIKQYDDVIENIRVKNELVSIFNFKIKSIENLFIKYNNVRFSKEYKFIYKDITKQIKELNSIVVVILNGGTFETQIELNNQNTDYFIKHIEYEKISNCNCFAIHQIKPLLKNLNNINNNIYLLSQNKDNKTEYNKLLKQSEPYFRRIIELGNTVSYKVNKSLNEKKLKEKRELESFILFESIAIFLIIGFSFFLAFKVFLRTKRIVNKLNKTIVQNSILSQSIEQSSVSFVVTDTEGNIEYVNDYFTKQTGFTKEEVIGRNPKVLKSGLLPDIFYKELWDTINSGKVWKGEFCNQNKVGKIFWERAVISPIKDNSGHIINFVAVKENVTETKDLENSLKESSQVLETVMNNLPVGIMIFNKNKQIKSLNIEASRILQYNSVEEANSKLINNICHDCITHTKKNQCPIFDLGAESYSLKERILKGKETDITVLKSTLPITINGEEVLLEAFMDITSQKQASIREKEANIAKSEFLANMSHELRTPLNGIIGSVEILQGLSLNEEQAQSFSIIQSSGENLLNIINDILDFSKIEANKITLEAFPFNLVDLVEQVINQFSYKAIENHIDLLYIIDENVPENIIGDKVKVMQILVNLIGNAFKFTSEGEIILSVEQLMNEEKSVELSFTIEDSGIGIPEDKLDHIFDAFSQADNSTTRVFGGTGLGTTISKNFVEKMDGHIKVVSPNPRYRDKGSVFSFTIKVDADNEISKPEITYDKTKQFAIVGKESVGAQLFTKKLTRIGVYNNFLDRTNDTIKHLNSTKYDYIIFEDFKDSSMFIEQINNPAKIILITLERITKDNIQTKKVDFIIHSPIIFTEFLRRTGVTIISNQRNVKLDKESIFTASILLVEDNIINQKVGSKLLKQMGCTVDIAENGKIGVEKALKYNYDIVFMDVQMPVMNGLEATVALRDKGCSVTIIAMTANATVQDREVCLVSGMNNFLSKPIRKNELVKILNQYGEGNYKV